MKPIAPAAAAISVLACIEMRLDSLGRPVGRPFKRDRDLPAQIEPAIIVEAVARVLEAIADEHEAGDYGGEPCR